jgi:hypothetical protein
MHWREWLKSALVAIGGGSTAAISAAMVDPTKFNLSNGIKDEAIIAAQGALVGLAALFIRSPLGASLMSVVLKARAQADADHQTLLDHHQTLLGHHDTLVKLVKSEDARALEDESKSIPSPSPPKGSDS